MVSIAKARVNLFNVFLNCALCLCFRADITDNVIDDIIDNVSGQDNPNASLLGLASLHIGLSDL